MVAETRINAAGGEGAEEMGECVCGGVIVVGGGGSDGGGGDAGAGAGADAGVVVVW